MSVWLGGAHICLCFYKNYSEGFYLGKREKKICDKNHVCLTTLVPQLEIFEGVGACLFSASVTRECMRLCSFSP